ncbi:MAG TPA: ABC transporter substrate-binding protein [Noviherbaspirillum sp.]|nr:ABC transporter substrate-binding protein [Noviherbaspirillum sp.]
MTISRLFRTLALVAGAAFSLQVSAQGVTNDEIVLGQTTALTGPLAELGIDATAGAKAYFDYVNAQGGVNGRKIKLISLDDGYNPQKAVMNVKQLVEKDQVLALFGVLGTPANVAIMPLIQQVGIPNFGPASGSNLVRQPFNRLVFHVIPGYSDELAKIVEHLTVRGISKIGVVYQDNPFGKEGLIALEQIMAAHNMKLAGTASIDNTGSDASKAVDALIKVAPQAIVMVTAGKASFDFIKTYNQRAVGMQYFALSVMASQSAIKALGKDGVGVVVSQTCPFPFSATSRIVQEYQQVMKKMGVKNWSFASMGGFIEAKVMVDGLRHTGRNLTRERLIESLETMGKIDYDGFTINYSKTNHLGHRYVDLTVISKDGRFLR